MSLKEEFVRIYDIIFRQFAHRAQTGLVPIGHPLTNSPVVVTGNYTETVRRMKNALKGENVWLLVANSKGINVWCAAGGGHFTHHDVISAIITSEINDKVSTRTMILPQLGATGIERRKITESTEWKTIWGPARLEDLQSFLRQHHVAPPDQRYMRFPFWERMEMATMWGIPMVVIGFLIFLLLGGWRVGLSVSLAAVAISYGIFGTLPKLMVKGWKRWITFATFAVFGCMVGWLFLLSTNYLETRSLILSGIGSIIEMLVLSMDLAGTTPWYGSYINTFKNDAHIDLVEDRCNASGDCLLVCPRNVFKMNGRRKRIEIVFGEDCIECGACIVQCPQDALQFRYDNGRIVEASTIRKTRMNMLGRRTIIVREPMEK